MPLYIVKEDIKSLKCDAIVSFSNDIIENKATIKPCFEFDCKYVIRATLPDVFSVISCYRECLDLAIQKGLESVAIPFASKETESNMQRHFFKNASSAISRFLRWRELTVYLVVDDENSDTYSRFLHQEIEFYIKNNYIDESFYKVCNSKDDEEYPCIISSYEEFNPVYEKEEIKRKKSVYECRKMCSKSVPFRGRTKIEDLLDKIDDTFAVSLMKLIDVKKMTDVECYKKANVSKQTWYKILNEKDYKPSKNTVIAFAIALKLSYSETQKLLATVGFTLSKSSKFDLIIEYFLQNGVYDIMQINETLFEFDQPCLGV